MSIHNESYSKMQALCGLKVGDTVKLIRHWEKGEFGYAYCSMTSCSVPIDSTFIIHDIVEKGIVAKSPEVDKKYPYHYYYPFFVLQLVPFKPVEVALNSSYTALIQKNGDVKVGCQTFDKAKVLELAAKVQEVSKENAKVEEKVDTKTDGKIFPYNIRAKDAPIGAIFTCPEIAGKDQFKQLRKHEEKAGDCQCYPHGGITYIRGDRMITVLSHESTTPAFKPYETTPDNVPVGATFTWKHRDEINTYQCVRPYEGRIGDCINIKEGYKTWFTQEETVTVIKLAE